MIDGIPFSSCLCGCPLYERSNGTVPIAVWLQLVKLYPTFKPGHVAEVHCSTGSYLLALLPSHSHHMHFLMAQEAAFWPRDVALPEAINSSVGECSIGTVYPGRPQVALSVTVEEITLDNYSPSVSLEEEVEVISLLAGFIVMDGCLIEVPSQEDYAPIVQNRKFRIKTVEPSGVPSLISHATEIKMVENDDTSGVDLDYNQFDYIGEEDSAPRKAVESLIASLRGQTWAEVPNRLLIVGPPAVGKSHLVKTMAKMHRIPLVIIFGAICYSPDGVEAIRDNFQKYVDAASRQAAKKGSVIILLDDIDLMAPKLDSDSTRDHHLMIKCVREMITKVALPHVGLIACTNVRMEVEETVLEEFPSEVLMFPPTPEGRHRILQSVLKPKPLTTLPKAMSDRSRPVLPEIYIQSVAKRTIGFVPGDLVVFANNVFERLLALSENPHLSLPLCDDAPEWKDIAENALRETPCSIKQDFQVDVESGLTWDDVGGLETVRERIHDLIEWPLKEPALFRRFGIRPPRGILLHGPPGCSKTTIAKILANSGGFSFYSLSGAQVYSAYLGESERMVRAVFANARLTRPSLIFFDEIDAMVGRRGFGTGSSDPVQERVLSTFLTEMDGVQGLEGVLVLGATNRLDAIDEALLRPGRFDEIIAIPLPSPAGRLSILKAVSRKTPLADDVDFEEFISRTEGWSGAQLKQLIQESAVLVIREDRPFITQDDLRKTVATYSRSS